MLARLINLATDETFDLQGETSIGRNPDCSLVLPSPSVSRLHSIIRQQEQDSFWIADLGSANGCYVNGQRVTMNKQLANGDTIWIYPFEFKFLQEGLIEEIPRENQDHRSAAKITLQLPAGGDFSHLLGENAEEQTASTKSHHASSPSPEPSSGNLSAIMLVSDLKSFTKLGERLKPDDLAHLIGGWYRLCTEIIEQRNGHIDKFIGDAVLAYWVQTPDHFAKHRAVDAGRQLLAACRELETLHANLLSPLGLKLRSGVGIHAGEIMLGSLSGNSRTILGDAVNVTFRLEHLTRQIESDFLLSHEMIDGWPDPPSDLQPCGEHQVKGREASLRVYSLPIEWT